MHSHEKTPEQQAGEDAAHRHADELGARVKQRESPGQHRGYCELVDHQTRSIVDQAFAFQHDDHAARDIEPRQNCSGRYRIGRRNNRAEHEGRTPWAFRDQQLQRCADRQRRHDHEPDGEQPDRTDVGLEVAPRSQQRRLIKDRRQHQHEDELRIERKLRQVWHEAKRAAADHQRYRIGKIEMPRDPTERHRAQQ